MKSIAAVLVAVGLACTVYISHAADAGSRPPGVLARDWVRLGDRFGFVVTHTDGGGVSGAIPGIAQQQVLLSSPENIGADLMPPLKGYFVIQTPGGWRPVVMSDPIAK